VKQVFRRVPNLPFQPLYEGWGEGWLKTDLRKILALTLVLVVFMAATTSFVGKAEAQESGGSEVKAKTMFKVAANAEKHVGRLLKRLEARGLEVSPEAKTAYEEGKRLMEEAERLMEEGSYNASVETSFSALAKFKEALTLIEDEKLEALKAAGLEAAISRAEKFIERLRNLVKKAEEAGYSSGRLAEIEDQLNKAAETLEEARRLLDEGKTDEAARKFKEARRLLAGLPGELHAATKPLRARKAGKFLDRAAERMEKVKKRLEDLPVPKHVREKVYRSLDVAFAKLEKAREHVRHGALSEAAEEAEDLASRLSKAQQWLP